MVRLKWIALGAVVFVGCHAVEVAFWREWFAPEGDFPPWFLNAWHAVVLTASGSSIVGVMAGVIRHGPFDESIGRAANAFVGELFASGVTLIAAGPGTIFPIVVMAGACVLASSVALGLAVGWGLAEMLMLQRRRRRSG